MPVYAYVGVHFWEVLGVCALGGDLCVGDRTPGCEVSEQFVILGPELRCL